MTASTLDAAVAGAWPAIEKLVEDALGKPEKRALARIVVTREVPASTRVLLTNVEKRETAKGDAYLEHEFTATPVPLVHRQYQHRLEVDQLKLLASGGADGKAVGDRVTDWAENALRLETLRLTNPLKAASTALAEDLGEAALRRTRETMAIGRGAEVTLLHARGQLADGDERNKVRAALAGGEIVELPLTSDELGALAILVASDALEKVALQVAVDFELGWDVEGGDAVVHLDRRTSELDVASLASRAVLIGAPPKAP